MATYEFTCPECARAVPFTDDQRVAALTSGCPVCGAAVAADHFASTADRLER